MPNDPRRLDACPADAGCSIINSANPSRYKIAGTNGICMVGSSGVIRLWIMVSFSSALAFLSSGEKLGTVSCLACMSGISSASPL
jgi:hypothetical protein